MASNVEVPVLRDQIKQHMIHLHPEECFLYNSVNPSAQQPRLQRVFFRHVRPQPIGHFREVRRPGHTPNEVEINCYQWPENPNRMDNVYIFFGPDLDFSTTVEVANRTVAQFPLFVTDKPDNLQIFAISGFEIVRSLCLLSRQPPDLRPDTSPLVTGNNPTVIRLEDLSQFTWLGTGHIDPGGQFNVFSAYINEPRARSFVIDVSGAEFAVNTRAGLNTMVFLGLGPLINRGVKFMRVVVKGRDEECVFVRVYDLMNSLYAQELNYEDVANPLSEGRQSFRYSNRPTSANTIVAAKPGYESKFTVRQKVQIAREEDKTHPFVNFRPRAPIEDSSLNAGAIHFYPGIRMHREYLLKTPPNSPETQRAIDRGNKFRSKQQRKQRQRELGLPISRSDSDSDY